MQLKNRRSKVFVKNNTQVYKKVRILGFDFKFKHVSLNSSSEPEFKISLIEEYEIEKWWENPDPCIFETISKLWQVGYKIGLLTDSALSSRTIREVLSQLSLYVHKIVSSRDVGVNLISRCIPEYYQP